MKHGLRLINIDELKPHEQVDKRRLRDLVNKLEKTKTLKNPVVVEKETKIILDGHHRVEAFRIFKLKKIPAVLVSYKNSGVKVYFRRKRLLMEIVKKIALIIIVIFSYN